MDASASGLVVAAGDGAGEAAIAGELRPVDGGAEPAPVGIVADGDGDPFVLAIGRVDAVRGHHGVVVAAGEGDAAVDGVVEQGRAHEVERGFGLGLVDVGSLAGAVAVVERGQQGRGGEARGEVVGVGGVGADGVAAGVAGEGDVAADGRAHRAEAGDVGERAVLPEEAGAEH